MKRFIWSVFVAFWACVGVILTVGALAPVQGEPTAGERVITLEELALHDQAGDCWQAIDGRVYDLTAYIPEHPTPAVVMTIWCGKDATEAWLTKGYGRPHSARAGVLLERYFIGVLAEAL